MIGAGKVGCTLGKFFATRGHAVVGYYSRTAASAREAARFTQTQAFDTMETLVQACDVLFLTVPDRSLTTVFQEVQKLPIKEKCICHCSGALSAAEAFPGIQETGAFGYSVHPLFAISDKYHAYEELTDIFFALEGDPSHLDEICGLFAGCRIKTIPSDCKIKYHAAAAMVSNLAIALMQTGLELMEECGFTEEEARSALAPLIHGNIIHFLEKGSQSSLTGAVERCDIPTVAKHLACLSQAQKKIYTPLSRVLVEIAAKKHPETDYSGMAEILKGE